MKLHDDLMEKLEALSIAKMCVSITDTGDFEFDVLEAYRALKSAPAALVLEAASKPETSTALFLNHLIPYVIFKDKVYRLPEDTKVPHTQRKGMQ